MVAKPSLAELDRLSDEADAGNWWSRHQLAVQFHGARSEHIYKQAIAKYSPGHPLVPDFILIPKIRAAAKARVDAANERIFKPRGEDKPLGKPRNEGTPNETVDMEPWLLKEPEILRKEGHSEADIARVVKDLRANGLKKIADKIEAKTKPKKKEADAAVEGGKAGSKEPEEARKDKKKPAAKTAHDGEPEKKKPKAPGRDDAPPTKRDVDSKPKAKAEEPKNGADRLRRKLQDRRKNPEDVPLPPSRPAEFSAAPASRNLAPGKPRTKDRDAAPPEPAVKAAPAPKPAKAPKPPVKVRKPAAPVDDDCTCKDEAALKVRKPMRAPHFVA